MTALYGKIAIIDCVGGVLMIKTHTIANHQDNIPHCRLFSPAGTSGKKKNDCRKK
jgi:hypothetical protein